MAESRTITAAAGSGLIGAFVGFAMDPDKGLKLLLWLDKEIGAVGFVAIISLGAMAGVAVFANLLMWTRIKEKDQECQRELKEQREEFQAELSRQRTAWKSVVDAKEAQMAEIAGTVTDLLIQVTLLAERAGARQISTHSI